MLCESEVEMQTEPIPQQEGAVAPRARLAAQLRACRAAEDSEGERVISLELARIHFDNAFDVDMAVQLQYRALEIEDDAELRTQLARQLVAMGRHVEAGHVLRDGQPRDASEVFNAWLESGEAYARGGDAEEAVATFHETALIAPNDPLPFARIAAIAYWAPDVVRPERAADAWLEAATRYPAGSDEHFRCVIRAIEVAPAYARSAETYTRLLERTARTCEADEVWRQYGIASGHIAAVAAKRTDDAAGKQHHGLAMAGALEACIASRGGAKGRDETLDRWLRQEPVLAWLENWTDDTKSLCGNLVNAARTKSSMGRGEALAKLAKQISGEARAVLLVFAAEAFAAAGNFKRACRNAQAAAQVAPWLSGAQARVVSLGGELDGDEPAIPLAAMELAAGNLPARTAVHRMLADRYDKAGCTAMARAWNRQMVELRPGDIEPLEALLKRAIASQDPSIMVEAVMLVLGSPRPWHGLSSTLGQTLRAVASCHPRQALETARQVLATIGPGTGELYQAIRHIAADAGDSVFEVAATLGRAIGDDIADDERASVYLEAAELSLAYGDIEAAAEHVSRAAAHAGEGDGVASMIAKVQRSVEVLESSAQSDANITLARATAWAAEHTDPTAAVAAWRKHGALRWDLADDPIGGDEALFMACVLEPNLGPYRYARDLASRTGETDAVTMVLDRAATAKHNGADGALVARLYAAAARLAKDAGNHDVAVDAAVAAVRTDPSRADAVAIVEKLATEENRLVALNLVYNTLANAALGRYGFRAAHFSAARQLEQLHAYDDALQHAIAAFEAVPSVGASYRMLVRLSQRAGNEGAAVSALVSGTTSLSAEDQASWLIRAADLAQVGSELQFELFLKAFALHQTKELVELLGAAARDVRDRGDADIHVTLIDDRLDRAVRAALPKLEGLRAADVAIELAVLAAGVLARPTLMADALVRAAELDPNEADYTAALDHRDLLCSDKEAARRLVQCVDRRRGEDPRPIAATLEQLVSDLAERVSVQPQSVDDADTAAPSKTPASDQPSPPVARPPATQQDAVDNDEFPKVETEHVNWDDSILDAPPSNERPRTEEPAASDTSDASDTDYSPQAESEARRRGDHRAVAEILSARARITDDPDERRLIRLRRAAVLEQRLNSLEEACVELDLILQESGDDPTALRYLAGLCDRQDKHARAAKLWLRASQGADDIDEKIRDVVRCCESLVAADRPETAQKLIDAARGLPQSPKLLRLRIAVARKLEDRHELAEATAQLEALDTIDSSAPPPSDEAISDRPSVRRFSAPNIVIPSRDAASSPPQSTDAAPSSRRSSSDRQAGDPSQLRSKPPPATQKLGGADPSLVSSRRVFRVTGAPPDSDTERSPGEVLEVCHEQYLERGPGGPREAKRMIRRLRSIADRIEDDQRDLHTFLMVESLDAAQGTGAATLAMEQHWETHGQTPLVGLAVAERLVRRGDARAALKLYRRIMDEDLLGVRSRGNLALTAAHLANRLGDDEHAQQLLDIALQHDVSRDSAERLVAEWSSGMLAMEDDRDDDNRPVEPFELRWNAADAVRSPSRVKTNAPPASESSNHNGEASAHEPPTSDASATSVRTNRTPSSRSMLRVPSLPELATATEEEIFEELIHGSYEAGETLIAMYGNASDRTHDVLTVRRYQAMLRRGNRDILARLRAAATADQAHAYAQAVGHVLVALDSDAEPIAPPALKDIFAPPRTVHKLLLSWLDGTVNEALGILSDCGITRRALTEYHISGSDRVEPTSTTVVGRVYAALAPLTEPQILLFHRDRAAGPIESQVALVTPPAVVVTGNSDEEDSGLVYQICSALLAAAPQLALVEALPEQELCDIIAALLAGFGPVEETSVKKATTEQIRLAENLWHLVGAADERRLRSICSSRGEITYEAASVNAKATRRRAGLFGCGDVTTAIMQTVHELDLPLPRRGSSTGTLRDLCRHPAIADLYDLAIHPEYADARWQV